MQPRRAAAGDISAGLPGTAHGTELGAEAEEDEEAFDRELRGASPSGARGSDDLHGSDEVPPPPPPPGDPDGGDDGDDGGDGPPRRGRGPARPGPRDVGVGENPQDWTRFDFGRTLRVLRLSLIHI